MNRAPSAPLQVRLSPDQARLIWVLAAPAIRQTRRRRQRRRRLMVVMAVLGAMAVTGAACAWWLVSA